MCRPGMIGMTTDHTLPFAGRVMGALVLFQRLKSPTTDTLRAVRLLNANRCATGSASAELLVTGWSDCVTCVLAFCRAAVFPRHTELSANPANAAAAAIPAIVHKRVGRRGGASITSPSAGVTRAAAAAVTTRRIAAAS